MIIDISLFVLNNRYFASVICTFFFSPFPLNKRVSDFKYFNILNIKSFPNYTSGIFNYFNPE